MRKDIILVLVVIKNRGEGLLQEGVGVYGVLIEKLERVIKEI
jgi:hypothetical protein